MKILRIYIFSLICFGYFNPVSANDFEMALGSDTAQITFRSDSSLIGWGGADLAFSLFYNENSDVLGQVSLLQARQATQKAPLTLGVGVKTYLGRLRSIDANVLALGIGGEVRYTIPGVMPMSFYLNGHFAPRITSFIDAEDITEYVLGFQIEVLPQTIAFVGVRHLEVGTSAISNYKLDDDNIHVGVRLTF